MYKVKIYGPIRIVHGTRVPEITPHYEGFQGKDFNQHFNVPLSQLESRPGSPTSRRYNSVPSDCKCYALGTERENA